MSTVESIGENPSKLASGINRITVSSASIHANIPNVNPRNNVIRFFSSVTNSFHSVTVPEGFYTTPTILITAVRDTLNTISGTSGLTFSYATIVGFPDRFNLNSAGGSYYFDINCSAIKYGYQLWNLPIEQVASNSKLVGDILLYYTRYIDITSNTIIKYSKIKALTTGKTPDMLFRVPIEDPTKPGLSRSVPNLRSTFNYLPNESIFTIDFSLYDQFGNILYIPPGSPGTAGGFLWSISLLIEL
jgi:hypothetical protein